MSDSRKRGSRNQEEELEELDDEDEDGHKRAPSRVTPSRTGQRRVEHADLDEGDDDDVDENEDDDDVDDNDDKPRSSRSQSTRRGPKKGLAKTGFIANYWEEAKEILVRPRDYFQAMPIKGGLMQPMLFLLISASIFSLLQAISKLNFFVLFTAMFSSFATALVAAAVLSFACSKMGGKGTFESTLRVIAYSKVTLLFAWLVLGPIPAGGIASLGYSVYLNILGLEKVQKMPRKNVATLVIIVALIGFILKFRFGI